MYLLSVKLPTCPCCCLSILSVHLFAHLCLSIFMKKRIGLFTFHMRVHTKICMYALASPYIYIRTCTCIHCICICFTFHALSLFCTIAGAESQECQGRSAVHSAPPPALHCHAAPGAQRWAGQLCHCHGLQTEGNSHWSQATGTCTCLYMYTVYAYMYMLIVWAGYTILLCRIKLCTYTVHVVNVLQQTDQLTLHVAYMYHTTRRINVHVQLNVDFVLKAVGLTRLLQLV